MKKVLTASLIFTTIIISTAFVTGHKKVLDVTQICHSGGITGYTGFNGESSCNLCHSVPFGTKDSTSMTISIVPNITNDKYIPGQTYTVNVSLGSTTLNHFGFDCEILNSTTNNGTNVGTISPLAAALTQTVMIFYPKQRMNVTHGIPAQGAPLGNKNEFTFVFFWTAPVTDSAFINIAGMAVNLDGYSAGDDIAANKSLVLSPMVVSAIEDLTAVNSSMKIFPNPSSDVLNIQYDQAEDGEVKADLTELDGKILAKLFTSKQSQGNHTKTVFLPADIVPGIYMIKILLNKKQLVEKLIIIQSRVE